MKLLRVGVLALQGNFREHAAMLRRLGADPVEVRKPEQLADLDGLIIPGGESTAIGKLIDSAGLDEPLRRFAPPVFGTCAGMILLARDAVDGVPGQKLLGLADLSVRRNAFGRQVHSFELELAGAAEAPGAAIEGPPLEAVFIRAPWIESAGQGVEILAQHAGHGVLAREGRILVAAFHPELTDDTRVHELFLQMIRDWREAQAAQPARAHVGT
jgi:5'-phosphate synthase pdxT subunit